METETLTVEELGRVVGKTAGTIRYDLCRHPERLPPSFVLPGSRTRLFLRSTVVLFLEQQAAKFGADPQSLSQKSGKAVGAKGRGNG